MKNLNRIITALCLAALCLSFTSCLKDDPLINWKDMKSVIELPYKKHYYNLSKVIPGENEIFKLMVNYTIPYASDNKEDISVQLGVDESMVETHNATYFKDSELLPPAAYSIPSVVIKAGTRLWEGNMTINTSTLKPGVEYVLPIVIKSVPQGYIMSGNFHHLYLRVQMK